MKTILITLAVITGTIYLSSCSSSADTYIGKEYELNNFWILESLHGVTANSSNWPNGIPYMTLKVNSTTMSGSTGCNTMGGSVYATSDKIYFGNIISTRMYCEGVDEFGFTSALQSAGAWTIENGRLFLYDHAGGAVLAVFRVGPDNANTEP